VSLCDVMKIHVQGRTPSALGSCHAYCFASFFLPSTPGTVLQACMHRQASQNPNHHFNYVPCPPPLSLHRCKAWVSYAQMEKRWASSLTPHIGAAQRFDRCRAVLQRGLLHNPTSACLVQVRTWSAFGGMHGS
jgi:hypothetical protein